MKPCSWPWSLAPLLPGHGCFSRLPQRRKCSKVFKESTSNAESSENTTERWRPGGGFPGAPQIVCRRQLRNLPFTTRSGVRLSRMAFEPSTTPSQRSSGKRGPLQAPVPDQGVLCPQPQAGPILVAPRTQSQEPHSSGLCVISAERGRLTKPDVACGLQVLHVLPPLTPLLDVTEEPRAGSSLM